MTQTMSVELGSHLDKFAEEQLMSGRYGSVSEVVEAGLSLLEAHETELDRLREAPISGEESGRSGPIEVDRFLGRMHRQKD